MITVGLNACIVDENNEIRPVDGGGVCLFEDDKLLFAITEERLTYKKYDGGFKKSLEYVLEASGKSLQDVDQFAVSFYGVSLNVPKFLIEYIQTELSIQSHQKLIIVPSHHLSHAYAAFYSSGFKEALIVVNDNEGQIIGEKKSPHMFENSCERNSYYLARNGEIELIDRDFEYPQGLGFGKLYNKFTRYLGMGNYHNAGKTMGLASFGSDNLLSLGEAYIKDYDGSIHCIIPDTGSTEKDMKTLFKKLGVTIPEPRKKTDPLRQMHADLAQYVQKQLEKWTTVKVEKLTEQYNLEYVCVGGGVALNCPTNSALLNIERVKNVYIPNAPQDQGLCIGNAIYAIVNSRREKANFNQVKFEVPLYSGKKYTVTANEIQTILKEFSNLHFSEVEDPCKIAAKLIAEGNVIAWFQGASEFGPRALGNRSILGDPRDKLVVNRLNLEIKKREAFRPFAPSVLIEKTQDYFENFSIESPSMMFTADVKKEQVKNISGVVHVDGTARLQTVNKQDNPMYYRLIQHFGKLTGIYLVINTSFNLDGMPIVETPYDAIACFNKSELDYLVIENFVLRKI
ncbi:carbamoyltransferase family protein [Lysinibacillus sp. NPDC047702]|uniref:carbamoyltransferase family protein n=1 Tax=unclassified Lysinibacillus TaxID=2636778 RepID=UPI003D070BA8